MVAKLTRVVQLPTPTVAENAGKVNTAIKSIVKPAKAKRRVMCIDIPPRARFWFFCIGSGGPVNGPPLPFSCVSLSDLVDRRSRPDSRAQAAVRRAALNNRATLFGYDADRGRNDHSAHIAALFGNVARVGKGSGSAKLYAVAVELLVVRAHKLETKIRNGSGHARASREGASYRQRRNIVRS